MTRQRAAILDVLRSDKCHHTAEEIFILAKVKLPEISRATVYNNLRALEEEEIIRRISGDGGPDRYDNSFIPHAHLVCSVCGAVSDFELPHINEALTQALGEEVDSYELKVRGRCSLCKSVGSD